MRILFMGTPDIAAESLNALIAAGHDICAVFTPADKPVGRKHRSSRRLRPTASLFISRAPCAMAARMS